jgi:hypothetical protein
METRMPRFYFDLVSANGAVTDPDVDGGEFPSLDAAKKDAELGFADMVSEAITEGRALDFAAIDLRDEDHRLIETLRFDDKGKLVPAPASPARAHDDAAGVA